MGTYLLTQNKQGQPVTEQKGGSHRQKENKKAHLNHASETSHTTPRGGTRLLEAEAPAPRTGSWAVWTLSERCSGMFVQPGRHCVWWTLTVGLLRTGCDSKPWPSSLGRAASYPAQPSPNGLFLTFLHLLGPREGTGGSGWGLRAGSVPPAGATHPASGASPRGRG